MFSRISGLWPLIVLPIVIAGTLSAAPSPTTKPAASQPGTTQPTTQPTSQPAEKEPWISKPPAQWPQIHLSNELILKDKRSMGGASAGIVQLPDGRIVAATARHLLGEAGGFNPPLKLDEFNKLLAKWTLKPRASASAPAILGKLLTKSDTDPKLDCIAMSVLTDPRNIPAIVLKFRRDPLKPGDKVYILGVPYDQPKSHQNVYPGTVSKVEGDHVDFDLDADLATRGFSGAPVIDDDGHFAGIYVAHYDNSKTSEGHFKSLIMISTQAFADSISPK